MAIFLTEASLSRAVVENYERYHKNYVVIGPFWPPTKVWTNQYKQFGSYVSGTRKNGSFRFLM